jgi:hypothetical protein
MDDRIDAYLANYGKPPREAIRALLEPSDDNIRDFLRMQNEKLAIVAYVARRMNELRNSELSPTAPRREPGHLPDGAYPQMRVYLLQRARDPAAVPAMHALRNLNLRLPEVQAGVLLVGSISPRELRNEIARIDVPLSVAVVSPEATTMDQSDVDRLPLVRIEDLRNKRTVMMDARNVSEDQLLLRIAALRNGTLESEPLFTRPVDLGSAP